MNQFENLSLSVEDEIAVITLNRPQVLNALNSQTFRELREALVIAENNKDVRVLIITGTGKAFVAGSDIKFMQSQNALEGRSYAMEGNDVYYMMENSISKPIIAAVNGLALGGGCELAMACDIRIASSAAKFGQPEVNLGIIPGNGGTQRLPRLVGRGRAMYYVLTGEIFSASEALEVGLVEKVVQPEELMTEALKLAKTIATKAPQAIKLAKRAINLGMNVDLPSGIAYETEAFATTFSTTDKAEGMSAFLEKRPALFTGR